MGNLQVQFYSPALGLNLFVTCTLGHSPSPHFCITSCKRPILRLFKNSQRLALKDVVPDDSSYCLQIREQLFQSLVEVSVYVV